MDRTGPLPAISPRLKSRLGMNTLLIELPYGEDFGPPRGSKVASAAAKGFEASKRQAVEALERLRERCDRLQPQIEGRRRFTMGLLIAFSILVGGFFVSACWAAFKAGDWRIAAGLGTGGTVGLIGILLWPFRQEKQLFNDYITIQTWPERALVLVVAANNEAELRKACKLIYEGGLQ
jgi:hypothetical protein